MLSHGGRAVRSYFSVGLYFFAPPGPLSNERGSRSVGRKWGDSRDIRGGKEMTHFTTEDWIDFVNQVAQPTRKPEMEKHLERCEDCAKTVSRWQKIQRAAVAEPTFQPPSEAVRMAKAAFAVSEWARERRAAWGMVEVLFDSRLQPALEGIRSAATGTRRMLYRADPFRVDLQVEGQVGSKNIVVTGQLLDLRHPEVVGRDVPFMLSNLRGRVVQATTNQFGEFREEIESSGDLELVFSGANDRPVMISLQDVLGLSLDTKR